jgi:cytidylate kinase
MNQGIIIAIDGPAGSGKSTTARLVAQKLGYLYIDTGAMYRAVTLAWIKSKTNLTTDNVDSILNAITIELKQGQNQQIVLLNGFDVSDEIRQPDVTSYVSPISAMKNVRDFLVAQQRNIGKLGGVVMDGRDIGTVVFPEAELKIFLIATPEERAKRRQLELHNKGIDQEYESILKSIIDRDNYDSNREISPLRKASDAVELDTTNLSIEEQCEFVVEKALKIIARFNRFCG